MAIARLFAPFEGTRDPRPLAIVRIAFFSGLLLHFAPSLIWLDIGYGHGAPAGLEQLGLPREECIRLSPKHVVLLRVTLVPEVLHVSHLPIPCAASVNLSSPSSMDQSV